MKRVRLQDKLIDNEDWVGIAELWNTAVHERNDSGQLLTARMHVENDDLVMLFLKYPGLNNLVYMEDIDEGSNS